MLTARKIVMLAAGILFILQARLANAQAPADANDLEPDELAIVRQAVDLLKQFGESDKDVSAAEAADMVKKFAAIVPGPGIPGNLQESKSLGSEGLVIADKNNPKAKKMYLRSGLLGEANPPSGDPKCKPGFIKLLHILFHEGVHLNHPGDTLTAAQALGINGPALTQTLLAMAECEAHKLDARFGAAIAQGLLNNNPNNAPAWASFFADCTPQDRANLAAQISLAVAQSLGVVAELHKTLDEDCIPKQHNIVIQELGDAYTKDATLKGYSLFLAQCITAETVPGLVEDVDDPRPVDFLFRALGESTANGAPLDAGIASLQDGVTFFDSSERSWVAIAGNRSGTGPGVVVLLRVRFKPVGLFIDERREIPDPASKLGFVTSICRTDSGKFFVRENNTPAIYQLVDDDQDGIPDSIGQSAANLPQPDLFAYLTSLQESGNDIVARFRVFTTVSGNSPWLVFRDQDQNGFFESSSLVYPTESDTINPSVLGDPVAGAQTLGVAGTSGHFLLIIATVNNQSQVIGQAQLPQAPANDAIVQLSGPLTQGATVTVLDQISGRSSGPIAVGARRAVAYAMNPTHVAPKQEVEVTMVGTGFELIDGIRIDGKKAKIISKTPETIVFTTPKLKAQPGWEIEFDLPQGKRESLNMKLAFDNTDP